MSEWVASSFRECIRYLPLNSSSAMAIALTSSSTSSYGRIGDAGSEDKAPTDGEIDGLEDHADALLLLLSVSLELGPNRKIRGTR